MKTNTLLSLICVYATLLGIPTAAQADDRITLGRTIVFKNTDYGADIPLVICRRVNAIQVKADRDMYLQKVKITFKNGDTKTIRFYRDVGKDKTTDWRKLAYKRCVKKLEVFGKSENSSAGVRVYGRQ
ncbi:DUF2541 domain-containing protein [Enterovibrio norvegicus FF-33]|uniref:DUF2541 domain-containing protein n=1 Tax=Enterovibrio norvegicus FF-454 TaxID=1185651 RepID=A0A1E5C3J8_9GAMM|nr:DUF2541 family protein [Enterovibrio norvegicus]OEE60060.1 DUF2541 domain-containing protein [Enterovibrio norvegicus FF-454]OEE66391.1 DUF2541 domain-containing protein [Enterovibrio norvegicus FF-33]OEE89792.1 DUF2541 domain-containing protein [Enterovibrio norvegicus FF-162]